MVLAVELDAVLAIGLRDAVLAIGLRDAVLAIGLRDAVLAIGLRHGLSRSYDPCGAGVCP